MIVNRVDKALLATAVTGALGGFSLAMALVNTPGTLPAGWVKITPAPSYSTPVDWEPEPRHSFDLVNPWERCLAAMEEAEIPGDMWECHEPTAQPIPTP